MSNFQNKDPINAIAWFDPELNNPKLSSIGIKPTGVHGKVTFQQETVCSPVRVNIDLSGLTPYKTRAIHIHELGDIHQGCKSLGGHWNPTGHNHGQYLNLDGSLTHEESHAGDLINNIFPDDNGEFKYSYNDTRIQLFGNVTNSIIGKSVVIHDGIDDLGKGGLGPNGEIIDPKVHEGSLTTGNAGGRMACALIGMAKNSST